MRAGRSSSGTDEAIDDASLNLDQRLSGDLAELDEFARELSRLSGNPSGQPAGERPGDSVVGIPNRIDADQDTVEEGLAKLVLALIDLIRQLLEKQAIRRIEAGSLTDEEIERMGETFLKLERKMVELKETFGLRDGDLALTLGPVRDLLSE